MDGSGDDWDLAAVVRSCCSNYRPKPPAPAPASPASVILKREEVSNKCFIPAASRRVEGLEELYTCFVFNQNPHKAEACAVDPTAVPVPKKPHRPASQPPRSKRRKKAVKKVVCQVPADGMSSDMWAWRKYGQKPIKGSPYPRGYYRCSSFRGCPARKQVERNRSDPAQLIITYTSEHNHPMPARHKFTPTTAASSASDSAAAAEAAGAAEEAATTTANVDNHNKESSNEQPASSPTTSSASVDEEEEEEGEEAMLMVEDMEMMGEDELVFMGDAAADSSSSDPPCLLLDEEGGGFEDRIFASPWLDNGSNSSGAATAAAC